MTRALGVPVALVALVALPAVVAPAPAGKPSEPAAKEAALTVNLEGDQGGSQPYLFAVTAAGTPPTAPATLRDPTGLHTATLSTAHGCPSPAREAFSEDAGTWCLRLADVGSGHELSGSIGGGSAKATGARTLKLTVNKRDAFLGLPAAVLVAGFLVGAGAIVLKSASRKPIRRAVLGRLLSENRSAAEGERIEGLTEFARARLAGGEGIDDLIAKVSEMRGSGPEVAKEARDELKKALAEQGRKLAGLAFHGAAEAESKRSGNRVEDFYAADGSRAVHPATALARAAGELVADLDYAAKLRAAADSLGSAHRTAPLEALSRADIVTREATAPKDVVRIVGLLDATRDLIETARAQERVKRALRKTRGAGDVEGVAGELPATPVLPAPPVAAELGGADLGRLTGGAVALTALMVVAIVLLAGFTIKQAAYDPKLDFASFGDYLTLFNAALASSAAGAVVMVLGFWSPAAPKPE